MPHSSGGRGGGGASPRGSGRGGGGAKGKEENKEDKTRKVIFLPHPNRPTILKMTVQS